MHDSSDGQNRETCPTSDPSILPFSEPKLNGQGQAIETATDLHYKYSSKQTSEPNTDTETAYEPTPQTPLRQSDTPAAPEINDPTT